MNEVMESSELTPQAVEEAYRAYKKQQSRGRSIATANWVTTLAHPCEAYAVYMRTVPPEQRRAIDERLSMIFAEGNDQARIVKRDLIDAGFECSGEEGQVAWPKYQITGRRDLKLWKPGMRRHYPAEIKSCAPYTYDSINSVEDMKNHKWDFVQKWWKQIALYMVLDSQEEYWLILKNKSTGALKVFSIRLDKDEWDAAEAMLKKAERTNQLVQIGEMPSPGMKLSDPDTCSECEFFTVCLPELVMGPGATILTDERAEELAEKTARILELKPLAKEFKDLDEDVKEAVKQFAGEGSQVVYGDFVASLKRSERKAYSVKATTTVSVTFTKVGSGPAKAPDLTAKLEQSIAQVEVRK